MATVRAHARAGAHALAALVALAVIILPLSRCFDKPRGMHAGPINFEHAFLVSAIYEMEDYQRRVGRYPSDWESVGATFGCEERGPVRGEPPPSGAGARWRPPGCKSTFVIKDATDSSVVIQALDDGGNVEYEIEPGMRRPRIVSGAGAM